MELLPSFIKAPRSARYLSDFLLEGLPQNCLFDKAPTGCGGTYVALTCDKPYIVAVPTKALVKDKVENPTYLAKGLIGISEDYPLEEVKDKLPDAFKIIVTYKSLPSVCELLDISRFHLLVDEAHMLINMTSYARPQLKWILESFKSFKSYCFMSATIPRNAHLLPEIAVLDRINVVWDDQTRVEFECYISDHIMNSILKITADHKLGRRSGTPYFFYNTISGICKIVGKLKGLAPVLDDETAELFKSKPDSLKTICKLFEDNPMGCSQKYPEWFSILTELGVEVCKAKAYRKKDIKALYEKAIADNSAPVEVKVAKAFKIGGVYTMKQIKDLLVKCKAPKTSGAALKLWFEVQETKTNGKMAYRVIRKL